MPRSTRSEDREPPGGFLLAPKSGFRHYRWVVLVVAVVLVLTVVLVIRWLNATSHHLPPIGSFVVFISALAAALAGIQVGLATALVGVAAAFLLLADFDSAQGAANALVSAAVWCGAAVGTGLVARQLRRQVTRREKALEETLGRSLLAKERLERVIDFGPQFLRGETLAEVAQTTCESAVSTFGADSARLYLLKGTTMEILALCPGPGGIRPGYALSVSDFPDLESLLTQHRPSFLRDVRDTHPTGRAERLRQKLGVISAIRLPIVGPGGPDGLLTLGWNRAIDRPEDELLAVMQRYADQVAVAWHNALRLEAQRREDQLHKTLERVVELAPTFHITGSREEVARAICQAALATFECSGAALYRVESDRLRLLERLPPLEAMTPGRTFPLSSDMPLMRELRSSKATFVPNVADPSRSMRPWPQEVVNQAGTRSALYVPLRFDQRGPANLLVLSWNKPREQPDESLLFIVQRFADQAALALAHSSAERLHARLEASLLPTAPVAHPLLSVVTRYKTGEQRLRLGGDFVGSTAAGDGALHFVIGDVSGHGPDAAALGATLRSTWKALTYADQSLTKIAEVMNSLILAESNTPNAFATILAGRIDMDKRAVSWLNAGHLPPLLIADQVVGLASPPAAPLGIGKNLDRTQHRFRLPEHWSLFCYTDGLIEARVAPGAPQRYGEERLKERLAAWVGTTPDGPTLDALLREIEAGGGGRFADDVAVLLVSTKNAPESAARGQLFPRP